MANWRAARAYLAARWRDELGHLEPSRLNGHGTGNGKAAPVVVSAATMEVPQ